MLTVCHTFHVLFFSDSCTDVMIPLVQSYCQKVLETKNEEETLTISKHIGKLCYGLSSKIHFANYCILELNHAKSGPVEFILMSNELI